MSIVSSIRDYVEFLNNVTNSLGTDLTLTKFITVSFVYFLKTVQYSVYYIFSFQWLYDFTLLPITIPQISHAIFSENLFLETENASKIFFEFLEIPNLNQNKFLLGFFNSFFLTLPITATHLIAFRRLLIEGFIAAIFSFLGFIIGQTLFLFCVIFGIRAILIPWLSLEPFNYILGVIILFHIIYQIYRENLIRLRWESEVHRKMFIKFFIFNFILAWCEQTCIFQYFSNITISSYPSILEGFSTKTTLASFLSHSNYIIGILLGSIVFSLLWIFFILQIKNFLVDFVGIPLPRIVTKFHKATVVIVIAIALTSLPFYAVDYVFTGPLGFVSADSVFNNTMLAQSRIPETPTNIFQFASDPSEKCINMDCSAFDRGRYLVSPDFFSYEDLNYRGEADWIIRKDKETVVGNEAGRFFSIKKLFKNKFTKKTQPSFEETKKYSTYNSLISEDDVETIIREEKKEGNDKQARIKERFFNWYGFQELDDLEDEVFQNNFKLFNLSFSPRELHGTRKTRREKDLEKIIKQKYYSSPLYKRLLALDIDLFLNRQSKSSFLKKQDEIDLYQKRQALTSYYDSLRLYSKLPETEIFEDLFDGTKSFSNKVYNQQFKGTLYSIRRLFSLHIDSDFNWQNPDNFDEYAIKDKTLNSVLKYDQPLYESEKKFSSYHEEIPEIGFFEQDKKQSKDIKIKSIYSSDNTLKTSVLVEMITKPIYAGWDQNLRKFIITNKFLPRSFAGYEMTIPQDFYKKFKPEKQIFQKQNSSKTNLGKKQKIYFSSWPKKEEDFLKPNIPFVSLFDTDIQEALDRDQDDFLKEKYTSFPINYKHVKQLYTEKPTIAPELPIEDLIPKRGGFVWPGDFDFDFKKLYFDFKKLFLDKIKY